jgi:predicted RNase H-like HicB family nuclease
MSADSTREAPGTPVPAGEPPGLQDELDTLPYYPAALEPPNGDTATWSGQVPDLSGCRASGQTLEDAMAKLVEAMHAWITGRERGGEPIPPPTSLDVWARSPAYNGWLWFLIQRPPAVEAIQLEELVSAEAVSEADAAAEGPVEPKRPLTVPTEP